jgi:hypothetical protein
VGDSFMVTSGMTAGALGGNNEVVSASKEFSIRTVMTKVGNGLVGLGSVMIVLKFICNLGK